jgi:hypothetical protein
VSSTAFLELDQLVRSLGEELATFRRRALSAEARLRELEEAAGPTGEPPAPSGEPARSAEELERENRALRERLEAATERTRQMLERVRFLRQQQQAREGAR